MVANMALNLAPFGRWTLCDKATQRRLALRYRRQSGACPAQVFPSASSTVIGSGALPPSRRCFS